MDSNLVLVDDSELVKGPPTRVRGSRGAQLRGWAWDEEQAAPPESIVLVGEGGVVEGLANVHGRTQSSSLDTSVTRAPWKGWGTTIEPTSTTRSTV